jgi:hypothetical protein
MSRIQNWSPVLAIIALACTPEPAAAPTVSANPTSAHAATPAPNPSEPSTANLAIPTASAVSGASELTTSNPITHGADQLVLALTDARARHAGCDGFTGFGPLAAAASGPALINPCGPSIARVRCLETPDGYFVPVAAEDETCAWRLWFVPKSEDQAPVGSSEQYSEFDLEYTVDMFSQDFTGGGGVEAILIRGSAHPEGVGEGTRVLRRLPDGRTVDTPFDGMQDIDADGLADAILDHEMQINDYCGLQTDVWARFDRGGPTIAVHRLARGGFSMNDEVARKQRAKACAASGGPIIVRGAHGIVDEGETARRALCQAASGQSIVPMLSAIALACPTVHDVTRDCPTPRRSVCGLSEFLPGWLERVARVYSENP